MASDFSLPQFRFLERLLIVHGHWCYKRISKMVSFHFYHMLIYYLHVKAASLPVDSNFHPPATGSILCIQEHCFRPHSILLRHIHKFLWGFLIWWLVYGNVQCPFDVIASYITWSLWAGRFVRCMPPGNAQAREPTFPYKQERRKTSNAFTFSVKWNSFHPFTDKGRGT